MMGAARPQCPNPEFDNDVTVYGPDVRALVKRYMDQMLAELRALRHPDGHGSMLDAVELVVPHQANKAMVTSIAEAAGLDVSRLYFDIERVGNTSSASIPLALQDAVRDGVLTRPTRVFAPGFGAGAVGGYLIMRIDPAVVADEVVLDIQEPAERRPAEAAAMTANTIDDVRAAFGG